MFNYKNLKKNSYNNGDLPTLIIIRGVASSGKSSISKHLMKLINNHIHHINSNPFFLFPYEDLLLFHMMDEDFLVSGKKNHMGFKITRNKEGHIIDFKGTPWALKLYETYQNTINNYIENDFNIICEGNFINIDNIKNLLEKITRPYNIFIFSLHVPLDLLEKREKNRKDRNEGFSRLQFSVYEESLKNKSFQHILSIREEISIDMIADKMLDIIKNEHLSVDKILKLM